MTVVRKGSMKAMAAMCSAAALILTTSAAGTAMAQDGSDNSGTNPINFTWDWRSYVEMQDIGKSEDTSLTLQTIEQRMPVGSKANFRYRVRHVSLSLDPGGEGTSREISGLGDWDTRVLYVPKVSAKAALVVGLEASFNTASNRFLGSGKTTLGPQIFGVFFRPPGGGALIAPAYQYVFHVAGDADRADISRSQFDVFYLWLDKGKKWWVMANPQAVIDHEGETEFALLEAEYGRMMFAGLSSYVRPSVGIGEHRPYDLSAEFGLKVIYK